MCLWMELSEFSWVVIFLCLKVFKGFWDAINFFFGVFWRLEVCNFLVLYFVVSYVLELPPKYEENNIECTLNHKAWLYTPQAHLQLKNSSKISISNSTALTFHQPPSKKPSNLPLIFHCVITIDHIFFIQQIPVHFLRLSLSLWFSMSLNNLRRIERNLIERKYFRRNVRQKKLFLCAFIFIASIHSYKLFFMDTGRLDVYENLCEDRWWISCWFGEMLFLKKRIKFLEFSQASQKMDTPGVPLLILVSFNILFFSKNCCNIKNMDKFHRDEFNNNHLSSENFWNIFSVPLLCGFNKIAMLPCYAMLRATSYCSELA